MSLISLKKELRVLLAHAHEWDHKEYVIAMTVGSKNEMGEVQHAIFLTHEPNKIPNALSPEYPLIQIAEFQRQYLTLPTTAIISHVVNTPTATVIARLVQSYRAATHLPVPSDIGDVVLETINWE